MNIGLFSDQNSNWTLPKWKTKELELLVIYPMHSACSTNFIRFNVTTANAVIKVVKALCYKPESRGFDTR
jgi:antibiotic biosynthesis monooxygenase (ABM) superfamily enzyme